MSRDMKVRTRPHPGGDTELIVLIQHPMENGQRLDPDTGRKIPAHFIQKVTVEHNGRRIATLNTGGGVSQNPLLGFRIPGARAGDRLRIAWSDNRGESGAGETKVEG